MAVAGAPVTAGRSGWGRWWTVGGAAVGTLALGWVLWRVDYPRMAEIVAGARVPYLLIGPLAIAAEQLVRAWKWRLLLHSIRPIGTGRLFGAIMAGYFANMIVPLGISPLVRSWLIARLEALKTSTVLATAAIDRFVDGVVFSGFVAVALSVATVSDPGGRIRLGLIVGGLGSLALFGLLLLALALYKRRIGRPGGRAAGLFERLPARITGPFTGLGRSFAAGIVWPRQAWRGLAIVAASVAIKLIAITHFIWAGLAFDVVLAPAAYLFLVVFLGFLIILTRFARLPGGFVLGGLFALELLGVAPEPALAMIVAVQLSTILSVATVGALALWRYGIALDDLRPAARGPDGDG